MGETVQIRRLGPGDEAVLELLARDDSDFDLGDRGTPVSPPALAANEYLRDANVLHWIAEDPMEGVLGHLLCYLERRRRGPASQLLLYEIGVRSNHRRRGIGRSLLAEMERWMRQNGVADVWVLADNAGAEAFYAACGFTRDDEQPVQMSRPLT